MAGNASQALVLRFAADTAPARRAMQDLAQTGVSQMALLAGATAAAGKSFKDIVKDAPNILGAIQALKLGFLAFGAAAVAGTALALVELARLRAMMRDSEGAGVGADFFQRFTQAAGRSAEQVKLLTQALNTAKEATRQTLDGNTVEDRLAQFSAGGQLSSGAQAQREKFLTAGTQEERLKALISIIDDLRARGDSLLALDLAEKLFGRQAADELISRADRASASLAEMINTTADKKVVSPEQIENARQLEERLEAARAKMADGMKPILEDLEALGRGIVSGWVSVNEAIGVTLGLVGRLYSAVKSVADVLPTLNSIVPNLQGNIDARLVSINSQIGSLERQGVKSGDPDLTRLTRLRDQLQSGFNGGVFRQQLRDNAIPDIPAPALFPEVGPNSEDAKALAFARKAFDARKKWEVDGRPGPVAPKSGGGGGGAETDTDLEFFNKYVAGIEKASAALKTEIEVQGLSTYEKEKALATSKAYAEFKAKDIELSDEQKARLETLIDAQARLKEQLENTKNAMQAQRDLINFIGSNLSSFFSDMVSGGKNAEQALMNLGKRLADTAFQAMLLGQGPLAQLFGTAGQNGNAGGLLGMLFGGLKFGGGVPAAATAGYNVTGGVFTMDVGSRYVPRDGLAMLHAGEKVLTRAQNEREQREGAASARNVSVSISLDGAKGNREVEEIAMRAAHAGVMQAIAGEQQRNASFQKRAV